MRLFKKKYQQKQIHNQLYGRALDVCPVCEARGEQYHIEYCNTIHGCEYIAI